MKSVILDVCVLNWRTPNPLYPVPSNDSFPCWGQMDSEQQARQLSTLVCIFSPSLPPQFLSLLWLCKMLQRNGNKTFRRIRYFCYFCIYSHVLPQEIWRNSWDDTKTKITFIFCCYTKVFKTRKYMKVYWVHQSDGSKLKIRWHGWFSPMVLQYWGHA